MPTPTRSNPTTDGVPWWRVGTMWLVVGGPAAVVVAALVSGWVAMRHMDPLIDALAPVAVDDHDPALAPAVKARNHAATPQPRP